MINRSYIGYVVNFYTNQICKKINLAGIIEALDCLNLEGNIAQELY